MGKRGPKPWEPTDAERRMVEHYVSIGYTQPQIAALMGKSEDSLQRYCRHELDTGALKVNAQIGGKLFQKAMAGDTASLIFWAKTRMGWKETDRHEHTGKDGAPIEIEQAQTDAATFRSRLLSGTIAGPATGGTGET